MKRNIDAVTEFEQNNGEDMSHENEIQRYEAGSIPTLIEMHKKEIWEWKQKAICQWIND